MLELIIIFIQNVEGLTEKLYAYALARMKTCSHAKFQVKSCYGYLVTLLHEEGEAEDDDEEDENLRKLCLPVFHTSCDIFIPFLHAVIFFPVLHLDVLEDTETESEN